MKIFYFSHSVIPSRTANSIHVMKMCAAFAKNGHAVTLFSHADKKHYEPGVHNVFDFYGVPQEFKLRRIFWAGTSGSSIFYTLIVGLHLIPKVVSRPLIYSRHFYCSYIASLLGFTVIHEVHAASYGNKWAQKLIQRMFYNKNVKRLVVISEALKQEFANQPELFNKIIVAHDAADPIDLDDTVGLGTGAFNIGYVGHLFKGRGIDLLIQVTKRCNFVHLHAIGGTPKDIEFWRQETQGVKNITFHGFKPPREVSRFRNSMDILLAPYEKKVTVYGTTLDTSKWMSPLKIFEYMATRKAIISSDIPVLREVLTHEQNAILCPPEDIAAWVDAVTRLYNNPALRDKIANRAYEDFCTHYNWQSRAKFVISNI
jgi:glycosyltransferase involved in cell wall biosynthesis